MDYGEKLRNPKWQRKRLEIMQRAGFKCEECGDAESELNVHHKRYRRGKEPWEYSNRDLVCLCRACHVKAHLPSNKEKDNPAQAKARALVDVGEFSRIKTPGQLRSVLLESAIGVLEGRVSVPQANAVVGLSAEVHKSLRQEWDMRVYVADLVISDGVVMRENDAMRLIEPIEAT